MKPGALNLIGVTIAFAGFAAGAAEPALGTNAASAGGGGPRIQFAEPYFDFGRVQSGQVVTHNYVVTNTGDRVLEISDVQSSCGCAAATNWDRQIEPGKTGTIPVLFNSGGKAGPLEKSLWVICNDPDHPNVLIGFAATIWKVIDAIPTIATFNFGPDFQRNETRVIRLVSNLQEPVTLSEPICTNRSFKVELKTVQPGKEFELHITVVPPLGPGSLNAPITLKTSSPKMPEVTVTAYAMVQPALALTPTRIMLQTSPLAEAEQFVVQIRNNGTNPVTLTEPGINAKGASVQLHEVQPGRLFDLTVAFPAGFRCQVGQPIVARVRSDHQQSPVLKVPVIQLEPSAEE